MLYLLHPLQVLVVVIACLLSCVPPPYPPISSLPRWQIRHPTIEWGHNQIEGGNMLMTRIVQAVFIAGVGSITVLGVRALIQDLRAHRTIRLSEIPVDYDGEIRRKMEKR